MGNASFTLTKSYGDGKFWTEAIMDAVKSEVETQFNTVVKNNLDQLKADIMPSGYTYDDDAAANLTNPIYNKQTASDFYESNISIGTSTDVAYADVDAVNASLTFTPEIAGNYKVSFSFTWNAVSTGAAAIAVASQFRLIDGSSNASYGVQCAFTPGAIDGTISQSVTLVHVFNFTAVSQTIRLQKRNTTATNVGTNQVAGSSGQYGLYMIAEKI